MAGNIINPQLAAILQNLAQLSQPQSASQERPTSTPTTSSPSATSASQNASSSTSASAHQPYQPQNTSAVVANLGLSKSSTSPETDPSTITEFPAAAKYVVKIVASDPAAANRIKRLIKNQHDNEKTWWNGRQALVEKHKARVEGRKQVDTVLKALGVSKAQEEGPVMTVEEEQAALDAYDRKVYAALGQMATAINRELIALNIPLFVIKHSLVNDGAEGGNGAISKEHLAELLKKMMQFLEDLFGE